MSGRICELHVGVLILTPFLPFFYLVLQLFRQCCIFVLFLFSYQYVTGYYEKKILTMMLLHSENRNKRVTFTGNKKHDRSAVHNILNLEKKYHPVGAISKSNTKIIVTKATSMPLIITQITNRSLSCLGTSTLIKKKVVGYNSWLAQASPFTYRYIDDVLSINNSRFFHWYILQSWKLKRPPIQLHPHHFWTYTSNLTTVVNSVLKFMISGTTSILKS